MKKVLLSLSILATTFKIKKPVVVLFLAVLTLNSSAQVIKSQEPLNIDANQRKEKKIKPINLQEIKKPIIASGLMLISGSVFSLIKSHQRAPEFVDYDNIENYKQDKKIYIQKQRDLQLVSTIFYGLSGVTLISVTYKF